MNCTREKHNVSLRNVRGQGCGIVPSGVVLRRCVHQITDYQVSRNCLLNTNKNRIRLCDNPVLFRSSESLMRNVGELDERNHV